MLAHPAWWRVERCVLPKLATGLGLYLDEDDAEDDAAAAIMRAVCVLWV